MYSVDLPDSPLRAYLFFSTSYKYVVLLPWASTTPSRFQRQAWVHQESSRLPLWHGSPASSPKTGTVKTELVAVPVEGCLPRPKVKVMPWGVWTIQYSPSLSPLSASFFRSTRQPGSCFARQTSPPAALSFTSSDEVPSRD